MTELNPTLSTEPTSSSPKTISNPASTSFKVAFNVISGAAAGFVGWGIFNSPAVGIVTASGVASVLPYTSLAEAANQFRIKLGSDPSPEKTFGDSPATPLTPPTHEVG